MTAVAEKKYDPFADLGPDAGAGEGGARAQMAALEQAASTMGFARRGSAEIPVKRKRGADATTHQFTQRVRVRDSNAYVEWCERHRLPYHEAFRLLVAKIPEIEIE